MLRTDATTRAPFTGAVARACSTCGSSPLRRLGSVRFAARLRCPRTCAAMRASSLGDARIVSADGQGEPPVWNCRNSRHFLAVSAERAMRRERWIPTQAASAMPRDVSPASDATFSRMEPAETMGTGTAAAIEAGDLTLGTRAAGGTHCAGSSLSRIPQGQLLARREGIAMHGYVAHKDDALKRLRRIEGQVRGLQRLVEEDA